MAAIVSVAVFALLYNAGKEAQYEDELIIEAGKGERFTGQQGVWLDNRIRACEAALGLPKAESYRRYKQSVWRE